MIKRLFAFTLLLLMPALTHAGADAAASFKVAEGFEMTLWASDPMLAKPIQMNWDAAGRLWVASSTMYPQIKPGEAPRDQVVVLEDTDADGKADKSTIFADKLLIPTGVIPGDGGAYVANSTELLHLKDTDGDGKADQRRVVLSGFGTEDTHHMIHTFRWGMDGRLYFNQSIYIHSHVETPRGVKRLMGSGTWRFAPETMKLDIVSRGMVNPWGHVFDEWGNSLQTDGAGGEGIYYVFPGAAFQSAVGYERILSGMNPGSPKYCGLEIVTGRHMPDDWQGNLITNDFRANRIVRYQLVDENGVFVSKQMPDLVTSTDVAFRPVDVQMGPDGAIYVADWCNPIINHGEVDFRDPRRDKTHGRIWRIAAKGRPLVNKPKLVGAPVAELLEHLKSPEGWTRQHAKLVLRERFRGLAVPPEQSGEELGRDAQATEGQRANIIRALGAWVKNLDASDRLHERHRVEALWVYQALDTPAPELLGELLNSKTPQARSAATRVVADWAEQVPAIELLAQRVKDPNPRVRIEAVRGLARLNTPRAIELAMTALDMPRDANLDYALWVTAKETESTWMPALRSGELTFNDNPAHAGFALQAVRSPQAAAVLAEQLRAGKTPASAYASVLELIGAAGGPGEVGAVYDVALAADSSPERKVAALAAVERSIRGRGVAPADADGASLRPLIESDNDRVRAAAMRLAGAWRVVELREPLRAVARDGRASADVRRAALMALAEFGGESADVLRQLDAPPHSFEDRTMAIVALSALDLTDAAARAAALLAEAPATTDPAPLIAGFLQRNGGGDALAAALAGKRLAPDVARMGLRHVETTGRDEVELSLRLRDAAGISPDGSKALTPEQLAQRVEEVRRYGDAARGEAIFRRSDVGCFACHAIHGAGSTLGPDLSSIGASAPVDYLIESIIEPNKAVKDGYQSVIVATKDNDVHSGIKVSEDDEQIVLRDAVRDRIVIPLDQVKKQRPGGSLMPTGLTDALPSWEFLNLVRFLSELGKPGPYQARPALLVRRWRMLPRATVETLLKDPSALKSPEASAKLPWQPAYSLVSGELPPDAMAEVGQEVAVVRGEIEVTTAGRIALHLSETRGLSLWVNGTLADVAPQIELDLPPGLHALTFKVDIGMRGQGLRVEVRDLPGSRGHARPVGGR